MMTMTTTTTTEKRKFPPCGMFKVIMVGDSGSGKTCLIHRYMDGGYDGNSPPTVGMLCATVDETRTQPLNVSYDIWDTAGTERFRSLLTMHYRGAGVVILVYDVNNEKSFEAARTFWRRELLRHVPLASVFLVGNKCDLPDKRVVSTEIGEATAASMGFHFIETSSVTGENVNRLFREIACTLFQRHTHDHLELSGRTARLRVRPAEEPPKKNKCCVLS